MDTKPAQLSSLIEQRNQIYQRLNDLAQEKKRLNYELKEIDKSIKETCSHQWEMNHTGGAYSNRYYICTICKSESY